MTSKCAPVECSTCQHLVEREGKDVDDYGLIVGSRTYVCTSRGVEVDPRVIRACSLHEDRMDGPMSLPIPIKERPGRQGTVMCSMCSHLDFKEVYVPENGVLMHRAIPWCFQGKGPVEIDESRVCPAFESRFEDEEDDDRSYDVRVSLTVSRIIDGCRNDDIAKEEAIQILKEYLLDAGFRLEHIDDTNAEELG